MRFRSLVTSMACAAALSAFGASSAFAGEITGSGKPTAGPAHAASECVFNGLNDDPNEAFPFGGVAQSYGRLVAQGVKDEFPSPGVACNPSKSG
jgi:hypothetical protein